MNLIIGDQAVEQYPNNHPASIVTTYHQNDYYSDKSTDVASYVTSNNEKMGCYELSHKQAYTTTSFANGFPLCFSGSQSDGEITLPNSDPRDIGGVTRQL